MKDHLLKLRKEEEGQVEVKTPTENQSLLRKTGVPKLDDVPPEEVKYPGWNDWRVPEDAGCQDTLGTVGNRFIRCGRPAKVIIALEDDHAHPYYMCRECARFAVIHRGGKYLLGGSSGAAGT